MDHGFMALMIPILALSIPIIAIWTKHRKDIAQMEAEALTRSGGVQSGRDSARIAELEERVRVLERIVTEPGYDVASQIEALRDERAATIGAQTREKV